MTKKELNEKYSVDTIAFTNKAIEELNRELSDDESYEHEVYLKSFINYTKTSLKTK